MEIRYLIEPVEDDVRHPSKQLDQRHARIAHIVIGPLLAVMGNALSGFVNDVLELTVV